MESPVDRGRGALYAIDWLRRQGGHRRRALVIYPHGRLVPEHEPLPDFKPGLSKIMQRVEAAWAIPIFTRIHYGNHPLPDVDLMVGDPVGSSERIDDSIFEEKLLSIHGNLSGYFRCNSLYTLNFIWENTKKMRGEL